MPEYAKKPASNPTTDGKVAKPPVESKPTNTTPSDPDGPVSHALDAFARAEPGLIEAAASAYIQRTDKVEKKLLGAEGSENGLTGKAQHQSSAQATVYGRAEAVKLGEQYAVLVDAGLILGGSLALSGELEARYGKVAAKLGANLTLFGGVAAKVSGRAQIGSDGVVLEGTASAFVGAKGKGAVEATFDVGALGLGGELEAEGKVGAWAEA